MKKLILSCLASTLLILPLSSFTSVQNQKTVLSAHKKQVQTWDAGYFTKSGQMYHCYTDQPLGTIIAMYRSPGEGLPDGTALTTFSGYSYDAAPGLSVHVTFTDGTVKFYDGWVTY